MIRALTARPRAREAYAIAWVGLIASLAWASSYLPEDNAMADVLTFAAGKAAEAALETLRELQGFVGALDTALCAGCAALVWRCRDLRERWGIFERGCVMLTLTAAAASYYGLFLARMALLEMVVNGIIDPFGARLRGALNLQYYAFLAGAALLGLLFVWTMTAPLPTRAEIDELKGDG